MKRVGIYAGSFNPVHVGHIAFALQAMKEAKLDKIYFLPERRPRFKQDVEHFAHRVGMLRKATAPHPQFCVMELDDVNFTVERTLRKLEKRFEDTQLVFLMGSDVALQLMDWPLAEHLLYNSELVIGLRQHGSSSRVAEAMKQWPVQPLATHIFTSFAPEISSRKVREALYNRRPADGLLESVRRYSNRHWLYVSLA
jgi:nicotinate-nucleotide adenylyltransferase